MQNTKDSCHVGSGKHCESNSINNDVDPNIESNAQNDAYNESPNIPTSPYHDSPYFCNPLFEILRKYLAQTAEQNEGGEEIQDESIYLILNACVKSFLANIPVLESYKFNTEDFRVYHRQETSKYSLDDESCVRLKQKISQTLFKKYKKLQPARRFSSTLSCPISAFHAVFENQ